MNNSELKPQILAMKQGGMTYEAIGKKFGFSRQYAQQLIMGNRGLRGLCLGCGRESDLENHHISYVPEIVETLCASCHGKKHPKKSLIKNRALEDKFAGFITVRAYAERLGCSVSQAREVARIKSFKLVKVGARPSHAFNWDLPNKLLAEIWLGKTTPAALVQICRRRVSCGSPKAIRDTRWIRWTKPKDYPISILDAIEKEKEKCALWNKSKTLAASA